VPSIAKEKVTERRVRASRRRPPRPPADLACVVRDLANLGLRVGKAFRRVLKKVGLRAHRPYDLRHTTATTLLTQGAPIHYVAHQLGHSNPATTLRHYARWIPGQGRRWVETLDPMFSETTWVGSKPGTKVEPNVLNTEATHALSA